MDARKVGLGTVLLAVSGAILIKSGLTGGRLLLGVAVAGVSGLLAGVMRNRMGWRVGGCEPADDRPSRR